MKYKGRAIFILLIIIVLSGIFLSGCNKKDEVTDEEMQSVYREVATPFKYGLVLVPADSSLKLDCPFIFRQDSTWYMTYIVFDGKGYESWIVRSTDLLNWAEPCRILSFPADTSAWDASQRAAYPALADTKWGGSYRLQSFSNSYWMSYLGGRSSGYEKGKLSVGISRLPVEKELCSEWDVITEPVLSPDDRDVRWWENIKLYKSTVIMDDSKQTGHRFVMFYNAYGDSLARGHNAERIGMAVSDDMITWKRFMTDPVLNHFRGISGDPQIARIGDLWVMFYFGAFWNDATRHSAFDRFACSRDLVHWTDWSGENLVSPSEEYDRMYAHKPCVVKWNGTVYHFYCAVDSSDNRGIALATSKDLGKSKITF